MEKRLMKYLPRFELTEEQYSKVLDWDKKQNDKQIADVLANPEKYSKFIVDEAKRGYAYYGPAGGHLTYSFTPTSIGDVVKVEHTNGEVLDLTDYDMW